MLSNTAIEGGRANEPSTKQEPRALGPIGCLGAEQPLLPNTPPVCTWVARSHYPFFDHCLGRAHLHSARMNAWSNMRRHLTLEQSQLHGSVEIAVQGAGWPSCSWSSRASPGA